MILMYYWTPKRIKELKEKGLKLKFMTLKEANERASEQANKQESEQASSDQASEEDSSNKR